jgi:hypothetical protein
MNSQKASRGRVLAALQQELEGCRVPGVHLLAGDLEILATYERERGLDWIENHIARARSLLALAKLAQGVLQRLHAEESSRHALQLKSRLEDEALAPKVQALLNAGEPVKVIMQKLGISKDRTHRIKALLRQQNEHRKRIAELTSITARARSRGP